MAEEFDNRIKLQSQLIDFVNDVGVTGQDHDTFPDAGQSPRYDWMRSFLDGILSMQSSFEEPTEKRHGTLWFDRNKRLIKAWNGDKFVGLAEFISVSNINLLDLFSKINLKLTNRITMVYNAIVETSSMLIPIPQKISEELVNKVDEFLVLVFANGKLINPGVVSITIGAPVEVQLSEPVSGNITVIFKSLKDVGSNIGGTECV